MDAKVIKNTLWMLSEKFFSIIGTLIVTVMTARFLGAEKTGFITYIITLFAFLVPLSSFGIQNLIFDRGSKKRATGENIIIATEGLRTSAFIILSLPFLAISTIQVKTASDYIVIIILLLYTYYQSKDVYSSYFNSILASKFNVIFNQVSLIISQCFRVLLVLFNSPFFLFAIPYVLLTGVAYFLKKKKFFKKIHHSQVVKLKKKKKVYKRYLLSAGLPLAISSISIMVYMRIGQIILGEELGMSTVGYYNAASTLAQGWIFIPTVIVTALFNRILSKKADFEKGFATTYFHSTLVSLTAVIFIYFYGALLISVTFGDQFEPATDIVFIIALGNLFGIWGLIGYRIIITMGGFNYLLKKAIVISLFNVILTKYMISEYGLIGAAYSITITELLSATLGNYLFRSGYILKINILTFKSWNYIKFLLH
ncbi:TPA: oligosaccharide flippase family protein [Providencia rettgeri]